MTNNQSFSERLARYEKDPEYLAERLILDINEQICELMNTQNVSRAELADLLNVSRAHVTKILNGNPNLTMLSLVKIATALNAKVNLKLTCGAQQTWHNFVEKTKVKVSGKGMLNDFPAVA